MEKFPIKDVIEQAVTNSVNSLVGNNDVNLNTIVKMSLMDQIKPLDESLKETVMRTMYENNKLEEYLINQEYELTYDLCGNLVYMNEKKD